MIQSTASHIIYKCLGSFLIHSWSGCIRLLTPFSADFQNHFCCNISNIAWNMKMHVRGFSWIMISSGTLKTLAPILHAYKHTWHTQQGIKSKEAVQSITAYPQIVSSNIGCEICFCILNTVLYFTFYAAYAFTLPTRIAKIAQNTTLAVHALICKSTVMLEEKNKSFILGWDIWNEPFEKLSPAKWLVA